MAESGSTDVGAVTASAPGTLAMTVEGSEAKGTFTRGDDVVSFQSVAVNGTYEVQAKLHGLTLDALVDPVNGVSNLDGFSAKTGADTQMMAEDRELLMGFSRALNDRYATAAQPETARFLNRAVSLWAENPTTVELKRTVMGEQGRGYTMLCSYAKCSGSYTGTCGSYTWYNYGKHDCQHGGSDLTINQQIVQLGDHSTCSGDELYWTGSTWACGEPDHWSHPQVRGICFGRVGAGCGSGHQYTVDGTNHDGCVRNGHALASAYCDDEFTSASDDALLAPDCY